MAFRTDNQTHNLRVFTDLINSNYCPLYFYDDYLEDPPKQPNKSGVEESVDSLVEEVQSKLKFKVEEIELNSNKTGE